MCILPRYSLFCFCKVWCVFYLYGFLFTVGHAAGICWVLWKSDVFRESVFRKLCLFRLVYVKFKLVMFGFANQDLVSPDVWWDSKRIFVGGGGVDIGLVSTLLLSL